MGKEEPLLRNLGPSGKMKIFPGWRSKMKTYNLREILDLLSEKHLLTEEQKKEIEPSLKHIVDTANHDLDHSYLRPYSHNIIGLALSGIATKTNYEVTNSIIEMVPAIQVLYKIQQVKKGPLTK
jgi:hypothetical protein